MDWRKKKKKDEERKRDFFEDIFGTGLDDEFDRMRRHMDKLFENIMEGDMDEMIGKPFVYGFSMKVGPNGKPEIREFGNKPRRGRGITEIGEREPLTDVIDGKEEVSVTVELPGIEKEDIDIDATDESLTIDVDTEKRKYHKEISLPCKVKSETTKATYKNGVLDIVIKKAEEKKRGKGKKITVK